MPRSLTQASEHEVILVQLPAALLVMMRIGAGGDLFSISCSLNRICCRRVSKKNYVSRFLLPCSLVEDECEKHDIHIATSCCYLCVECTACYVTWGVFRWDDCRSIGCCCCPSRQADALQPLMNVFCCCLLAS